MLKIITYSKQPTRMVRKGLTLIEVLVALVIISTSLLAAQRTISNTIVNYTRLQQNIFAVIISRNILTELVLGNKILRNGRYLCEEGLPFECQVNAKNTPNRNIIAAEILVYADKNSQTAIERSYTLLPKSE
ncbi:MAG: hypothetical protein RLZZ210_1079 [Pseudomonadota bacterium]